MLFAIGVAGFVISLIFLLWTFIGYPLFLLVYPKAPIKKRNIFPTVSIIIAAYNEEKTIGSRIKNCLELDYPKELLEIIVVDSGSTDNTVEVVKSYTNKGVKLLQQRVRKGKASAINFAKKYAKGEIIVITDANAFFEQDSIKNVVRNFADPTVGGVAGDWNVANPKSSYMSTGEDFVSKVERYLRNKEGGIDSIATFSGEFTAFRNRLIEDIPEDSLSEDMEMAIAIRKKGYRVVHEPTAKVYEKAATTATDQYKKHKRTAIGTIQTCLRNKNIIFNPKYGIFGMVILPSHKLFQLITPFILILLFISFVLIWMKNIVLAQYILLLSVILYLITVAVISFLKAKQGESVKNSIKSAIRILPYFLYMNMIVLLAWKDFIFRRYSVLWEKVQTTR